MPVCIGGVHRLRLLEPLLPFADELRVFVHPTMQSTIWQLYFGPVRFSLSLSRECWRGFSGEGAALDALLEDVPEKWIAAMDKYSYANQQFNPTLFAIEETLISIRWILCLHDWQLWGYWASIWMIIVSFIVACPLRQRRILSLNPRMIAAEKLLEEEKVEIISNERKSDRSTCRWERRSKTYGYSGQGR